METQFDAHEVVAAGRVFNTTHWSLVLRARDGDPAQARAALNKLCAAYRSPILAFIQREGYREADAEDLTQEFFLHLQKQEFLTHLVHQEGRFRSFLLKFLKHFLSDQRDKDGAQKRFGGVEFVSLDAVPAEAFPELRNRLTPEQEFERRWLNTLLARAAQRLCEEYVSAGKSMLFEQIKDLQPGERGEASYAEIGARLGVTEGAIKAAVHRLRRRHQELIRAEIAETVADPGEIDAEIRHLLSLSS